MSDDDDTIALSVPIGVASLYLIATAQPPHEPRAAALEVAQDLPEWLRRVAVPMMQEAWLTVDIVPMHEDLVPRRMLTAFGAAPQQLAAIESAPTLLRVRGIGKPWWQPYHDWAARAVATGLAARLDADIVDAFTPRVITADEARRSLPDAAGRVALVDWLVVPQSRRERGLWFTTRGLRRYGLPELQSADVPSFLAEPWTDVLCGIAVRLIDEWRTALTAVDRPSFVELPAVVDVSESDVARAFQAEPRGGGRAIVRLRLDPPEDPDEDAFLSVVAPVDFPSSAGEFVTSVCTALFGHAAGDVRRVERNDAMQAAIETARTELPRARQRFLGADLDLDSSLLVKHRLRAPAANAEYVWATITDWSRPDLLLGTSMNDAESDPSVRVGRPVRVSVDAVVDWAIWKEGEGIVEGGWTDRLIGS